MKDCRISGYFVTKYMTVLPIEQILHDFEDQIIAKFFNLEQVNFRVTLVIFPSHVSGQGYKIGPVYMSTYMLFNGPRVKKIGVGNDLDKISAKFEGQGHRSKVKVTRSENVILTVSDGLTCAYSLCHVIWCHSVMS